MKKNKWKWRPSNSTTPFQVNPSGDKSSTDDTIQKMLDRMNRDLAPFDSVVVHFTVGNSITYTKDV